MNARQQQREARVRRVEREQRQAPEWMERRGGIDRVRNERRVNDNDRRVYDGERFRGERDGRFERRNIPDVRGRDNSYFGYKNYGQYRSAQVHERNALRQASRDYDGRYYGGYYYDDPDYRYDVIRSIVYDRVYDSYSYSPIYNYYYYDSPYYGTPYNYSYYGWPYYYGYAPSVSYVYVPQYGQIYYDPYYAGYGYPSYYGSYYPSYYSPYYPSYATYGYSYPDYGYYDDGYYGGGLSSIIYRLSGNSFLGRLLSSFLSQGYDEGYLAGLYARDHGYYDDSYYDPYGYNVSYYDAYSANLAENRRIFSEGYEAGYRDAMMSRRSDYDPYYDSQPDLVSLFVGNSVIGI